MTDVDATSQPAPPDRPAEVVSGVERVYRELRESIINGDLAPGSPLRLRDLASTHGVSLIPIREALRRLEVERLVDSVPNKGARVAVISVGDVADVYATRQVLEVQALRLAWSNLRPDQLEQMRALRREMLAAYRAHDTERAALAHRRLHFTLYEAARSDWLDHLIRILWSHTERYRRIVLTLRTSFSEEEDLHGRILDAIEAGQRPPAVKALREDLRRTERLLVAHYRTNGSG